MTVKKKIGLGYILSFSIMLVINYWVGSDLGEVADQYQALIQPAGYVFSIWGLIYLLLIIWMGFLFFSNNDKEFLIGKLHFWPIANFILNSLWIIAFTQEWFLTSVILILLLMLTTVIIYIKIITYPFHWFDRLPFSIYFGWLSIASLVNIVTWVKSTGQTELLGLSEYYWTIILLIAVSIIALIISVSFKDWVYPLVFMWTFVGIIIENENQLFWLTVTASMGIVIHLIGLMVTASKIRESDEE